MRRVTPASESSRHPPCHLSLLWPRSGSIIVTFGRSGASAIAIAAGYIHTCVIVTGGAVKCWGGNSFGQLGIGNIIQQNSPVDVNMGAGMHVFV